ncbi:MAG: Bcr/CflA family efflux MFS transporter [Acidimicrobiales bacterium]
MTDTPQASSSPDHRSERHVVAFLAFIGILLALGIDIALPAFDEMRPDYGLAADDNQITLVISLYLLGMGLGQLIWGPLSDRFGRIRTLNVGIALYVVAAVAASLSPNLGMLFASRLLWGVGAAAPAGLRLAIARDLFAGDRMARIMSTVAAIFMVGPILAPLVGEIILAFAPWPWVFGFCAIAGVVAIAWASKFGETLDPATVQPLTFSKTANAFKRVLSTRTTMGYTIALALAYGSFYVFLGSTQPIMDNIYGRADQFAISFALIGILMGAAFLSVNRLIDVFGAQRVATSGMIVFVVLAIINLGLVLQANGRPSFWLWIFFIVSMNLASAPLGPIGFTLGLEPMGDLAGTASAVMTFLAIAGGSALSAVINALIKGSVTPMAIGYLLFGALSLLALFWAERQSPERLAT